MRSKWGMRRVMKCGRQVNVPSLVGQLLIVPQQGTMHFMSVEVAAQKFLFQPRFDEDVDITDFMQGVRNTSGIQRTTTVPFSHNHLHDLESLWWVAVWMVFYNLFSKGRGANDQPPLTLTEAEHQLKQAQVLFPSALKSTDRLFGFQISFQETYFALQRDKAVICGYLDGLRRILLKHYAVIESTLPHSIDPNTSENEIYEAFRKVFSSSKDDYSDIVLSFIPNIYAQLRRDMKRPRAESTNDSRTFIARKK